MRLLRREERPPRNDKNRERNQTQEIRKVQNNMEATHNSFSPLEAHLARTLKPIAAPQEVSRRMFGRIRLPERQQIARRLNDWYFMLILVSGVVSAAVALVMLARAIHFLVRRKG